MGKFYITTAIDYVNSLPHIGTAYEKIGADILARFHRQAGDRVHFEMGTDEHSTNVEKAARAQGKDPKRYCDEMAERFEAVWRSLAISYDDFIRTTDARHVQGVRKLFQVIHDKGDIYKGFYEGLYCESCEAFYQEKDLEEGSCPFHPGKPLSTIREENYFFALSRYAKPLLDHIRAHPEFIMPETRRHEIVALIEQGLNDISVSRAGGRWGIPLPVDESHVVYVWFDALINYITAVGYGWDEARFQRWWPAELHVIGKDITRFHCVIWPAMLLSAGIELPRTIFGHGFVYHRGERISKTLGNVINPLDIVDRFGPDPLRYFLMREGSFGKDSDFTWENFINRYNHDLGNDLGNLLQRTLGMIRRYQGGTIRRPDRLSALRGEPFAELEAAVEGVLSRIREALDPTQKDIDFPVALQEIWKLVALGNAYLDRMKPWSLQKGGEGDAVAAVLHTVADLLRIVAGLLDPFLPHTAVAIRRQLGLSDPETPPPFDRLCQWDRIPDGVQTAFAGALFPRIEPPRESIPAAGEAAEETKQEKGNGTGEGEKESLVSIEDFRKIDLRIGVVQEARRVEKTDKLLQLTVDLGGETRTLVAGIARAFSPETLIGRRVVVVANLQPAKIRGIRSQGMLLAAGESEPLALLTVPDDIPPGTPVR